ncbi:helix-turn-helix domain-containing protein [Providencia heimbachae]|uniref:HTH cro/C1-type domain-containing protein n=1 Tax=Providencia heimbachae ATCC 35613 TaxID=1354272 RepID=A0A1B7K1H5_9GAMM|nr:helix-turn-helix transcriptional regulator [Providencia heimbachae]OAT54010.1 hypothetical protein M998_0691 [Providencia heimbachae ATCC 35613]SQH13749.1 Helix-turn-helix [Providencia heimbachae]
MSALNHNGIKIQLLSNQISTLLFCALESSSSMEVQTLIEMAIEKNEVIKSELNHAQIKPETTKNTIASQNSFADRLKFALKEQSVTQGMLADWTGISQSTISSMATGKIKDVDTPRAEAIAKALDVSFIWLMHGEGGIYGHDFPTQNNGA